MGWKHILGSRPVLWGSRFTPRGVLHSIVVVFLATTSMGCSMLGLGIGMDLDARDPDPTPRTIPDVLALAPGSPIVAVLGDGSTVTGKYSNSLSDSGEAYGPAYARSRERLLPGHPIPKLGDRVGVGRGSTWEVSARRATRLVGMDHQRVYLRTGRKGSAVPWDELDALTCREGELEGRVLAEFVASQRMPSVQGVLVQSSDSHTPVLFTDVREFHARSNRGNAKWAGLGIGLIIDILVVYVVASSIELDEPLFGWDLPLDF